MAASGPLLKSQIAYCLKAWWMLGEVMDWLDAQMLPGDWRWQPSCLTELANWLVGCRLASPPIVFLNDFEFF